MPGLLLVVVLALVFLFVVVLVCGSASVNADAYTCSGAPSLVVLVLVPVLRSSESWLVHQVAQRRAFRSLPCIPHSARSYEDPVVGFFIFRSILFFYFIFHRS